MLERLAEVAQESSNGWNNAGTGHSALCEPNYTPEAGKSVDVHKAVTATRMHRSKVFLGLSESVRQLEAYKRQEECLR